MSLTASAEKTTTVNGAGGVVTYPEGHKAICPLSSTAVCATIVEKVADGRIEVGEVIIVSTPEGEVEEGVVIEILGEPNIGGNVLFQ